MGIGKNLWVALGGIALCGAAQAEGTGLNANVQLGTLGLGVGLAYSVTQSVDVRGLLNMGSYNRSGTSGDLNYDAKLKLGTGDVLLDWYPFDGSGFRLTGGASLGDNKFDITGKPNGSTYTLNGVAYTAPASASVNGTVKLTDGATPYVGLGFGTRAALARGFGWHIDFGALLKKPKATLSQTGLTGLTLDADLEAERVKLQDKLDSLGVYPVFSLGASYRF